MDMKLAQKLLILILGTAVIHFALGIGFIWANGRAEKNLDRKIKSLQEAWKHEDFQREQQQEKELGEKFGTNRLDRIAFDPRLDILVALKKLFQAAMPAEYTVEVSVDRFVEFRAFINVYNMPEDRVLAGYLKEVFSRVNPSYMHQVVFTDGDKFRLIPRSALLLVKDWKRASLEQISSKCFP